MVRRVCRAALLLALLFAPSAAPASSHAAPTTAVAKRDCVVYATRTGHKYHRAGCRYLRKSAIPMSRSKAISAGLTPCKICGGSDCE
jgi:hypothetical protein